MRRTASESDWPRLLNVDLTVAADVDRLAGRDVAHDLEAGRIQRHRFRGDHVIVTSGTILAERP